ncbi:hypothetical protein LCGC14_0406190 [marine sediment metagenome]|uniref:Uncharacterized protein n=1 Tax=marine sediment metagenome TaxID=412755 RepID=A0A0F9SVC1_9ZZZZ
MLKGQAKKDYQRTYMKDYMRNLRLKQRVLRPVVKTQELDADGNIVPEY